jgi:hypothetical protein
MAFHVGQKVVCVDLRNPPDCRWMDGDKPEIGKVYEVTGHAIIRYFGPCIFIDAFPHWAFCEWRFRPLTTQSKEISFTQGAPRTSERWDNRKIKVDA